MGNACRHNTNSPQKTNRKLSIFVIGQDFCERPHQAGGLRVTNDSPPPLPSSFPLRMTYPSTELLYLSIYRPLILIAFDLLLVALISTMMDPINGMTHGHFLTRKCWWQVHPSDECIAFYSSNARYTFLMNVSHFNEAMQGTPVQ